MSRSLRKPFYCPQSLRKAVLACHSNSSGHYQVQTKFRSACILPDFIGVKILVHNGKSYIPVIINSNMVGRKLGEFAPTRVPAFHGGDKKATRK